MTLPNKLTILRIIFVPFLVFFLLTDFLGPANKWIALALFTAASITDLLDGNIARKYHLVSNFGKLMDPLADKLLVCSALIALTQSGKIPAWVAIIVVGRELIISGIRLVASDCGVLIAASIWGKFKTIFQMFMIIFMIADLGGIFDLVGIVLMWISLALTVLSLIDYLCKNRYVIITIGTNKRGIETALVKLLSGHNLKISTAESCTGGMIASKIVDVPGASDVFHAGYVTYSNEAKEKMIGVRHETIERFGAVSSQTAAEMAEGAARASGSDVAVSSTGIAGPEGGTKEKPVGLVYIGIYVCGATVTQKYQFSGHRKQVRLQAVEKALSAAMEKTQQYVSSQKGGSSWRF